MYLHALGCDSNTAVKAVVRHASLPFTGPNPPCPAVPCLYSAVLPPSSPSTHAPHVPRSQTARPEQTLHVAQNTHTAFITAQHILVLQLTALRCVLHSYTRKHGL